MERSETKLAALGSRVRELLAFERTPHREFRRVRGELLQHVAWRNLKAASWPYRWRLPLLAGTVAGGALLLLTWARLPVTFKVGVSGRPGQPGDLVVATGRAPVALHFSDGSAVVVREGGRLRVLATDAKGARVLLEDGTVDVKVAPANLGKKAWRFEVGPFAVQVTGTRFELSYGAPEQSFGLMMAEGRVVVSGPCLEGPTPVTAGARLELSCLSKPPPASDPRATAGATAQRPGMGEHGRASTLQAREAGWHDFLTAGRLREGLRAAERAGFDRVCQTATSKELQVLADGARLYGHTAQALTALRSLRQRFPTSAESATASFTMGRIAFEQQHAYREAVEWFATYLREQPSGPLMGDAFGRLIEAKLSAGNLAGARADAELYLRRFPEGPYAWQARAIRSK